MAFTFKQFLQESSQHTRLSKLATKLNVSVKELMQMGEQDVNAILKNVGEYDFAPDADFDKQELQRGIEVEKEHTKSNLVAKLIAKDHLKEDPKYYQKLLKIENT